MEPFEEPSTVAEYPVAVHAEPDDATPRLVVLSGAQLGRKIPLTNERTTIGRSGKADVRLDDPSLSRIHAVIRCLPGGSFEVEDLGSRNGTFADGVRIEGPRLLQSGDRIRLGGHLTLQLLVEDRLDEQLAEAQKLETVGRLAAGIAHDFNNLLSVTVANMAFLDELGGDTGIGSDDVRACCEDIKTATREAAELTGRLAALVQGGDDSEQPLSLSDLCEEACRLIRRVMPRTMEVRAEIEPGLCVDGVRARLHQLLLNPCINARDAMPNGGTLTIRAFQIALPDPRASRRIGRRSQVMVEFVDSGPGMDQDTARSAFNPFFTTKCGAGGTGLGLATVAKVAREHGGEVEVETALGEGTTLRVLLPASTADHQEAAAPITCPTFGQSSVSQAARVLLVEDQAIVARSVARGLRLGGHQVEIACNGEEAFDLFRRCPPDVVVMDHDMPCMDGLTCLGHLREMDATVKIIMISGIGSAGLEERAMQLGAVAFMGKPLHLRELCRIIATASSVAEPSTAPEART